MLAMHCVLHHGYFTMGVRAMCLYRWVGVGCGFLGLLCRPVMAAPVQYNYTGMPFAVQSGAPSSVTHLSGWFRVDDGLVPRPTPSAPFNITGLVTAFSFTDGNQTLTKVSTPSFSF